MIKKMLWSCVYTRFRNPLNIIAHVTSCCNFQCTHCFAQKRTITRSQDLTLVEWETIARSVGNLTSVHISGGEPFLRDDLAEICFLLVSKGNPLWLSIPTNGFFPDKVEKTLRRLLPRIHTPVSIELSLDGLREEHDRMRGQQGSFSLVLDTYERVRRIKQQYPHLHIKILSLLTNDTIAFMPQLSNYIRTHMPEVFMHTFIVGRKRGVSMHSTLVDKNTWSIYAHCIRELSCGVQGTGNNIFDSFLKVVREMTMASVDSFLRSGKLRYPCRAALTDLVIWPEGGFSFCEMTDPLGNLKDYNFNVGQLWGSDVLVHERKKRAYKKCTCTHECALLHSILFNPKFYGIILMKSIGTYLKNRGHESAKFHSPDDGSS